jgi:hypothetical protein
MARAAGAALGRSAVPVPIPRIILEGIAAANAVRQALGGKPEILTAGKAAEMFHSDWVVHDRRLAGLVGAAPRHDLGTGFADTVAWYRAHKWL